jgi:hypothetical protein
MSVSGFTSVRMRRHSISNERPTSVIGVASSAAARLHLPLNVHRELLSQKQILSREPLMGSQSERDETQDVHGDAEGGLNGSAAM